MTGSQIIMDLPAGGYDYDKMDNTTGLTHFSNKIQNQHFTISYLSKTF